MFNSSWLTSYTHAYLHTSLLDDILRNFGPHAESFFLLAARFLFQNINLIKKRLQNQADNFQKEGQGSRLSLGEAVQLRRTRVVDDTERVACFHLQHFNRRITIAFHKYINYSHEKKTFIGLR